MMVKLPVDSPFHKFFTKISRPFLREVAWYSRAAPALGAISADVAKLSPRCYHSWTAYGDNVKLTSCERRSCLLCWLPFRKVDSGIMLLEDLTKSLDQKNYGTISMRKKNC